MAENTTTEAVPAVSRVVDPTATEDEIDLTKGQEKVTWTAPTPEPPETTTAPTAKAAKPPRRSGTSVLAAVLGFAALLLVILLGSMTAVLWNKVSDLEDQVDGPRTVAESSSAEPAAANVEELETQVADLQATADALNAAQAGDATAADVVGLTQRLDATIACINAYMDTVANATNSNASYVYALC
jgi:hypothetical protein